MKIASKVISGLTETIRDLGIIDQMVTFKWADESSNTIKLSDLSDEVIAHAAAHGLSQKLGDSYSGAKSVTEAQIAFQEVLDALLAGDWNRKGGASTGGIWVEALARASGETLADTLESWQAMDDATRKAVQKHPEVKVAKAQIELERAQAKVTETDGISLTDFGADAE